MNPKLVLPLLIGMCTSLSAAQSQSPKPIQMSNEQMGQTLDTIEKLLPKWEQAIAGIDPSKDPAINYEAGKFLEVEKDTATMQMKGIHTLIDMMRRHRSVYHELALRDGLWTMRETASELVAAADIQSKAMPDSVQLNSLMNSTTPIEMALSNDVMIRIGEMERSGCTSR